MLRRMFSSPQEPEPLFQVYVDQLVDELRVQQLSEPHVIEKKWLREQEAEALVINEEGATSTSRQMVAGVCSSWNTFVNIWTSSSTLRFLAEMRQFWNNHEKHS